MSGFGGGVGGFVSLARGRCLASCHQVSPARLHVPALTSMSRVTRLSTTLIVVVEVVVDGGGGGSDACCLCSGALGRCSFLGRCSLLCFLRKRPAMRCYSGIHQFEGTHEVLLT